MRHHVCSYVDPSSDTNMSELCVLSDIIPESKATPGCTGVTKLLPQIGCSPWTALSLAHPDTEFAISRTRSDEHKSLVCYPPIARYDHQEFIHPWTLFF